MSHPLTWLELTPDYLCNNRCVGCFSVAVSPASSPSMSSAEALRNLSLGRERGAKRLWLGGGEPTLRSDLIPILIAARRLGYQHIKLQTNGMRLAYPNFTRRLADAGLTEVNFSIKGATAEMHDALTRTPGCHQLLVAGIAEARQAGLALEGDVLLYNRNLAALPDIVRYYTALGLARFNLWLLSSPQTSDVTSSDSDPNSPSDSEVAAELPRITDLMPHLQAALDLNLSARPDFISSLHTPPCTVPTSAAAALFHAPDLGLLVTNPGGHSFMLETSPIEGGVYFERCNRCRMRSRCSGARAEYVARFGDEEFQPVG